MSESINKIKVKDITYDVEDSVARGSAIQDSSLQITTTPDSVSLSYTDLEGETFEVPIPTATTTTAGVMTAEDKVKLDNLSQGGVAELMEEVTYSELVALRDNASLVAGMKYRITDYVTTTVQKDTKSANHPFDVIVEAVSENELSELAQAIQHEGDTYFDGNDLGAWQLWYDIENDTEKYEWADTENGKGVIYRMIDEKRNDCPYDFKNILFYNKYTSNTTPDNYYYTFSYVISGVLYDGTIEKRVTGCRNNSMGVCIASGKSILNGNIFINSSFEYYCLYNTFGDNCQYNTFRNNCCCNTFGYSCQYNTFGNNCLHNTFRNNCQYNKFGDNCYSNTLGNYCYSNTLDNDCQYNTFGNNCQYNTLGNSCTSNSFGDRCYSNTLGNSCNSNSFGNDCTSNSFGDRCYSNTLGNDCYSNTLGNDCHNNSFGSNFKHKVVNYERTSITLNEEFYDDGSGSLVPIKHPDLSTQPSILPYKFMGQYVYEQLIHAGSDTIPIRVLLFDNPVILECFCIGIGYVSSCEVRIEVLGEEKYIKVYVQSDTPNYGVLYYKIVYTSMPEEGGDYYYNSAILKGILVKFNGLDATPGSLYDGSTSIEPVALDQGYHYDIPNDYGSSTGYNGFSISPSFGESITVQYSIPAFGETGTLERGIIDNPSYVPLPFELVDKAKQYLVIITIENI